VGVLDGLDLVAVEKRSRRLVGAVERLPRARCLAPAAVELEAPRLCGAGHVTRRAAGSADPPRQLPDVPRVALRPREVDRPACLVRRAIPVALEPRRFGAGGPHRTDALERRRPLRHPERLIERLPGVGIAAPRP
jgi:hypothetical protein